MADLAMSGKHATILRRNGLAVSMILLRQLKPARRREHSASERASGTVGDVLAIALSSATRDGLYGVCCAGETRV